MACGVRVRVRVTPGASTDAVLGPVAAAGGTTLLSVKTRAIADKGQANAAVCALIAKASGVPKSQVRLLRGGADRLKSLLVEGDAASILAALDQLSGPLA